MARQDALTLLDSATDAQIATRMLTRTPWIFSGDLAAFALWRAAVAEEAACTPEGVYVVGSSVFGYSLSPLKAGRDFRRGGRPGDRSDIDVVIVSDVLFDDAWNALRIGDANRSLHGTRETRDRLRTDVYWGFVGNTNVPAGTGPARMLRGAMAATTARPPFRGHTAKARVYRRHDDVIDYHVQSLRSLRKELAVSR